MKHATHSNVGRLAGQNLPAFTLCVALILSPAAKLRAEGEAKDKPARPRVFAANQQPNDVRLQPLKDYDGYFPFTPPESKKEWEKRASQLRRQLLVSLGLWPMPTRTPLQAVVHGKREMGEYSIEKVYFESMPGFYVTGNLYRPANKESATDKKHPAVLCPHGHWSNGRFYDATIAGVRKLIVQGAERFEDGGRNPLQSRCVQLARMGCIVFHYDMIGYADSVQISFELAHRFADQRPDMNTTEAWGLYSTQAEANLQSIMGLQTYSSIRALDFLESLPDVDTKRLAVTGASGGGTQTFILAAIDDRPAVAFPAVMVSTAMQGGCTCESASCLRVETGNVEIAALFAPKPLGLTAADDWTKEMETKGFPELQQHYERMGTKGNVMLASLTHFKHNYNYVSRANMYRWFNKHLKLGWDEPIVEEDYQRLDADDLTVWNDQHPKPKTTPAFERDLLAWWKKDAEQQIKKLAPTDADSLRAYKEVVGGGIDAIIRRQLPRAGDLKYERTAKTEFDSHLRILGSVRNEPSR